MAEERADMSVTIRRSGADHIDAHCGKIYRGDCIDVMDKMPTESVDMVFADPPYNLSGKGMKLVGNRTGGDFYSIDVSGTRYRSRSMPNSQKTGYAGPMAC